MAKEEIQEIPAGSTDPGELERLLGGTSAASTASREEKPPDTKKPKPAAKKASYPWEDPVLQNPMLAKHVPSIRMSQVDAAKLNWVLDKKGVNKQTYLLDAVMAQVEKDIKRLKG